MIFLGMVVGSRVESGGEWFFLTSNGVSGECRIIHLSKTGCWMKEGRWSGVGGERSVWMNEREKKKQGDEMSPYISFFFRAMNAQSIEERIIVREDDDFAKPKEK